MWVPIPIGNSHTATLRGSILKAVICCRCQHGYSYEMERESSGRGFSFLFLNETGAKARAKSYAEAAVWRALETECDPVPCPQCGTYQPNMVPQVKAQHLGVLRTAGLLVLTAAGIGFGIVALATSLPSWMVLAVAGPVGIALIAIRRYLGWRYDPNSSREVELRKAVGRQRVVVAERSSAPRAAEDQRVPRPAGQWVTVPMGLGTDGKAGVVLVHKWRSASG